MVPRWQPLTEPIRLVSASPLPLQSTNILNSALATMEFQTALQLRDFAACGALLQASRLPGEAAAQWRAWLQLRGGDAEAAAAAFASLGAGFELHRAACLFALHRYRDAQELALQVGKGAWHRLPTVS